MKDKRGIALKDFLWDMGKAYPIAKGDIIELPESWNGKVPDWAKGLVWAGPVTTGDEKLVGFPAGIYLSCWHGFKDIDARASTIDWGTEEPIIGPFTFIQTTYAQHLKCHLAEGFDTDLYAPFGLKVWNGEILELYTRGDCLFINDIEYGDWSIFYADPSETR